LRELDDARHGLKVARNRSLRNSTRTQVDGADLHSLGWDDLRHFAGFVRAGSLSAAAKRMGVDHATVARRLAALEESLGLKLIDRRARIPALTAQGERVAELVAHMEADALAVVRAARGLRPALGGVVSISAPPTIASALIAPGLPALRARHPDIHIRLLGEKRIASLARRDADVAIRLVRPAEAGLVRRRLGAIEFALYATAAYLAGRRAGQLEFIGFDQAEDALPQQRWLHRVAGARAFVLRTNELESQLAAARAGVGVALLPGFLAVRHPELERVAVRPRPITREAWLVVHGDLRPAPVVRAVMDFLVEATRDLS
jgi:DNA-binding transcriptional LysR family regulator